MSTVEELKMEARNLPEDQRFALIADLLGSLPVVLSDLDDGSIEAKRRLDEMKSDSSARRSWDEIRSEIGR
ncbi:addiction module protein [Coraliomargarita sp. W4R53]